jgi:hypothetical protein
MVLSDRTILELITSGRIRVEPFDPADIQPSSIDVHLGPRFQVFRNSRYPYIDPIREQAGLMEMVESTVEVPFVLHPGEFVLGATTASRARARWAGTDCSSTRPPATSTRASWARSRSSCRTWRPCR